MLNKKEIWTFGGSKGGVGKSLICSNIGIYLSQLGKKVLLIDADFGSANLHSYLGIGSSSKSLSDFLIASGDKYAASNIDEVIFASSYKNLFVITGVEDVLQVSNLTNHQISRLITALENLDYDYILIDLGAGTSSQMVDVFIEGTKKVLVCVPEPSAIENTYRFVRYAFLRGLSKIVKNKDDFAKIFFKRQSNFLLPTRELIEEASGGDQVTANKIKKFVADFRPILLMNMVKLRSDVRIGFSMSNACYRFFGIDLEYIGFIEHDPKISDIVKVRKPVLVEQPFSRSSRGIKKACDLLLNNLLS